MVRPDERVNGILSDRTSPVLKAGFCREYTGDSEASKGQKTRVERNFLLIFVDFFMSSFEMKIKFE